MAELGHPLTRSQVDEVYVRFTALADRKKAIYDQDLIGLLKADQAQMTLGLAAAPWQSTCSAGVGMKLKIAVLAGDGIGPEVTHEATQILRAVAELGGHDFTFTPG